MDGVQAEMLQRITRVETEVVSMNEKLDRALHVNETAVNALHTANLANARLDKIEDAQKWLWRTFAGAFVLAAAAFIISGGLK